MTIDCKGNFERIVVLAGSSWPVVAICQSGHFERNEPSLVGLADMNNQHFWNRLED
jgi:hypothetical protein